METFFFLPAMRAIYPSVLMLYHAEVNILLRQPAVESCTPATCHCVPRWPFIVHSDRNATGKVRNVTQRWTSEK